jgi:hypothetical protein
MHAVVHAAPGTEAPHDGSVTGAVSVSKPPHVWKLEMSCVDPVKTTLGRSPRRTVHAPADAKVLRALGTN